MFDTLDKEIFKKENGSDRLKFCFDLLVILGCEVIFCLHVYNTKKFAMMIYH